MTSQFTPATNLPGPPAAKDHLTIAFLGPRGTFTEQAVWQVAPAGAELIPETSVPQALEDVRRGSADRAVVPIENSIEGGVNATIDALSRGEELHIVAEMIVPVRFVLAVKEGTRLEDVRRVELIRTLGLNVGDGWKKTSPGSSMSPPRQRLRALNYWGSL